MVKNPQKTALRKENATNVAAIAVIAAILSIGSAISFVQVSAFLGLFNGQ